MLVLNQMLQLINAAMGNVKFPMKKCGGKEVLVEVLMIVISLSMVMMFKTQILQMATNVFEYCETFIGSNFSGQ